MTRAAAALLALATLGIFAPAVAEDNEDVRTRAARSVADRWGVVERTDAALVRASERRKERLRDRARAIYKLERAGPARFWADPEERELAVWRRLFARRLIRHEVREIELLASERDEMARARLALIPALFQVATAPIPEPASLARPLSGYLTSDFGLARHPESGTRTSRRGVRFESSAGDAVSAPAAGEVLYAGGIKNLEEGAVVEHESGVRSVLANLDELTVAAGAEIPRGATLGLAGEKPVHFELRLPIGPEGFPIDPEPLLEEP